MHLQPPHFYLLKNYFWEEFIIKQFNFYKTYADVISEFTNTEAASFIKKLCKFIFLDEKLNAEAKDKVTSILILLSATLLEERDGACTTRSKGKYFTFKSAYANVFYSLNDNNAGILIKAVSNYMFGIGDIKPENLSKVSGYFNLLKSELIKSKRKSQSGSKEKFTLEKIYTDFPNIRKPLARNSSLFKGVKMKDLYNFISTRPEEQSREMYDIMCDFLDNQMHNFKG